MLEDGEYAYLKGEKEALTSYQCENDVESK